MTRKRRECELLRHPLSFFSTTPLKKRLFSLKKPRSNMTVSKLPVYSSIPDYNCVLGCTRVCFPVQPTFIFLIPRSTSQFQTTQLVIPGCQRCRDHTFPSGFWLPPHFATPEADVGPFWPQAPRCASRGCNSVLTSRGKDLVLFSCACILHYFSAHILLSSPFPSFYLFSHHGHWS